MYNIQTTNYTCKHIYSVLRHISKLVLCSKFLIGRGYMMSAMTVWTEQ